MLRTVCRYNQAKADVTNSGISRKNTKDCGKRPFIHFSKKRDLKTEINLNNVSLKIYFYISLVQNNRYFCNKNIIIKLHSLIKVLNYSTLFVYNKFLT